MGQCEHPGDMIHNDGMIFAAFVALPSTTITSRSQQNSIHRRITNFKMCFIKFFSIFVGNVLIATKPRCTYGSVVGKVKHIRIIYIWMCVFNVAMFVFIWNKTTASRTTITPMKTMS